MEKYVTILNEDIDDDETIEDLEEISKTGYERTRQRFEEREQLKQEQEKEGVKLYEKYRETVLYLLTNPSAANEKTLHFKKFVYGDFENAIGKRLQHLRESRCLSKSDIYKSANTDRVNYDRIEKGEGVPRISTLKKILEVLDISLYDFLVPINIDEWLNSDSHMFFSPAKNIYHIRETVREQLSGRLSYKRNGKTIIMSGKTRDILINAIESAFDVLDLINHDDEQ